MQFNSISPVAIPPPAPSSFSQGVDANPPDFSKPLFQRSILDLCSTNPPPGVNGSGTILLPLHVSGPVGIVSTTVVGQLPTLTQAGFSIFLRCKHTPRARGGVCGGSNPQLRRRGTMPAFPSTSKGGDDGKGCRAAR